MRLWLLVLAAVLVGGCSSPVSPPAHPGGKPSTSAVVDPDTRLAWGPTVGELETARETVATWSPEQLAGQVIVGRFHGTDPEEPARMVRRMHLAGVSVTSDNVVDTEQVVAMTSAVARAAVRDGRDFPPVIGVDQEGGYVSHLRGVATEFPHFQSAGLAIEADPRRGVRVTRQAARAVGLELRGLGFTWAFAPVADVTIGSADPTIGARSPSSDPRVAARAVRAAVRGFNASGLVSTTKHFPGHGTATSDSHDTLPTVDSTLHELRERDLPPFVAATRAGAPAIMMSHLDMTSLAPGVPASLAPQIYALLRDELGFEGIAITDSLGMGALGGRREPAVQALVAGADLLLMPVDTRTTYRIITRAIESGEVSRERAEDAAARVVAVQLWQQRTAAERPVPDDVTERAQQAAADLLAAAY